MDAIHAGIASTSTTQTGGDPSYVEVLVCLQMGRDAGQIQRN
jgi:hypothetical protein